MPKNSITDYDNIANNNTDIQSVDIAENCAPSGINNAIREMMADLADVNDGTVTLTSPKATAMEIATVTTDTISEKTADAGVTIDGLTIKDGGLPSLSVAGDLTVDTNTLYVDSTNDRVGVGIATPANKLHVSGSNNTTPVKIDAGSNAQYTFSGNSASLYTMNFHIDDTGAKIGHNSNGRTLVLQTASTTRMTIAGTGLITAHNGFVVGAGGMNVYGNTGFAGNIFLTNSGASGYYYAITSTNGAGSAYYHQNYADTASRYQIYFYRNGGFVGSIQSSSTATGYYTTSDYRLKENVVTITDGIERLKQLKPSRFNFISTPEKTVDGFLAHEAGAVVPEAITGEKDGMRDEEYEVTPAVLDDDGNVITEAVMGTRTVPEYQQIDEAKIVPLLTAALQEAIAKIEALEARVAVLEGN